MTRSGYRHDRNAQGLTAREREVLVKLQEGKTQAEIGREIGVTRSRVNTIIKTLNDRGFVVKVGAEFRVNIERLLAGEEVQA